MKFSIYVTRWSMPIPMSEKISLADIVYRKWLRLCKIYNKPNYLVGFDEVLRNVESEEGIQIFYNFIVDRINEWVKREEECKLDCDNI